MPETKTDFFCFCKSVYRWLFPMIMNRSIVCLKGYDLNRFGTDVALQSKAEQCYQMSIHSEEHTDKQSTESLRFSLLKVIKIQAMWSV